MAAGDVHLRTAVGPGAPSEPFFSGSRPYGLPPAVCRGMWGHSFEVGTKGTAMVKENVGKKGGRGRRGRLA